MPCIGYLDLLRKKSEIEELLKQKRVLETERDCLRLAKECYDIVLKSKEKGEGNERV